MEIKRTQDMTIARDAAKFLLAKSLAEKNIACFVFEVPNHVQLH